MSCFTLNSNFFRNHKEKIITVIRFKTSFFVVTFCIITLKIKKEFIDCFINSFQNYLYNLLFISVIHTFVFHDE